MKPFIAAAITLVLLFADFSDSSSQHQWKTRKKLMRHFGKSASRYHSSYHRVPAPFAANANPQLPSYIEPMPIDPYRMLGKWYNYLSYFPNTSSSDLSYNYVTYFNNMGNETIAPGTDIPALLVLTYESTIDPSSMSCAEAVALTHLQADGGLRQTFFADYRTDPAQYAISLWQVLVASTDYDSYLFLYECVRVSNASRHVCEQPYVQVYTRDRPDLLTSAVITRVARETDRILGRYCFDASQMLASTWFPTLGECPQYQPTADCYTKQYDAWKFLAGTGPNNGRMAPRYQRFGKPFYR
ncbi:uncharacterized protein LOC129591138 [Paramacrobiotus metropolitanus]|uniref:uncharacterized protein LOC129591138 n=1 Tax=Paramacrobiotus metropolitanus TaxID=2943436 RepID=UPI00244583BF|nr:uncharacterized protein LOC129591138 [Paramacrobiotus metropolitanus]